MKLPAGSEVRTGKNFHNIGNIFELLQTYSPQSYIPALTLTNILSYFACSTELALMFGAWILFHSFLYG